MRNLSESLSKRNLRWTVHSAGACWFLEIGYYEGKGPREYASYTSICRCLIRALYADVWEYTFNTEYLYQEWWSKNCVTQSLLILIQRVKDKMEFKLNFQLYVMVHAENIIASDTSSSQYANKK